MVSYNLVNIGSSNSLLPDSQAITWINVNFSLVKICGIHMWEISQEVLMNLIHMCQRLQL